MANAEHLEVLRLGTPGWNRWRATNDGIQPDLSEAHLDEVSLSRANLSGAKLRLTYFGRADLAGADLNGADLSAASLRRASLAGAKLEGADLTDCDLTRADLSNAQLVKARLDRAYLEGANLTGANFEGAGLAGADLRRTVAVGTCFRRAVLTGSAVYGISAWNLDLEGTVQQDLVITPPGENAITTDNLQVAQFLYLILNNQSIRDVIETVGKKAILILGRFTPERKQVLEAVRDEVRRLGLIPMLFDFEGPRNRDVTETVSTLAHLARSVIADLTDARSIPQELMAVVPNLPSVRVLPVLAQGAVEYGMFEHFRKYPWVAEVHRYADRGDLVEWLGSHL